MCRGVYLHPLCGAQAELHLRILKKSFAPCCADLLYSFYHFWIPAHAVIAMLYFDNIFSQSQHYGWHVTKTKISVALLYFLFGYLQLDVNSFTTLFVYLPLWNVFTNLFVYLTLCYCIYHVVCVFTSTVATLFCFYYFVCVFTTLVEIH